MTSSTLSSVLLLIAAATRAFAIDPTQFSVGAATTTQDPDVAPKTSFVLGPNQNVMDSAGYPTANVSEVVRIHYRKTNGSGVALLGAFYLDLNPQVQAGTEGSIWMAHVRVNSPSILGASIADDYLDVTQDAPTYGYLQSWSQGYSGNPQRPKVGYFIAGHDPHPLTALMQAQINMLPGGWWDYFADYNGNLRFAVGDRGAIVQAQGSGLLSVDPAGHFVEVARLVGDDVYIANANPGPNPVNLWLGGSMRRVSLGAPDSCGAGYRCIRTPN